MKIIIGILICLMLCQPIYAGIFRAKKIDMKYKVLAQVKKTTKTPAKAKIVKKKKVIIKKSTKVK